MYQYTPPRLVSRDGPGFLLAVFAAQMGGTCTTHTSKVASWPEAELMCVEESEASVVRRALKVQGCSWKPALSQSTLTLLAAMPTFYVCTVHVCIGTSAQPGRKVREEMVKVDVASMTTLLHQLTRGQLGWLGQVELVEGEVDEEFRHPSTGYTVWVRHIPEWKTIYGAWKISPTSIRRELEKCTPLQFLFCNNRFLTVQKVTRAKDDDDIWVGVSPIRSVDNQSRVHSGQQQTCLPQGFLFRKIPVFLRLFEWMNFFRSCWPTFKALLVPGKAGMYVRSRPTEINSICKSAITDNKLLSQLMRP